MEKNFEQKLNERIMKGWNTWDTNNIMSYTLLPEGFSFNMGLVDYAVGKVVRNFLIGRLGEKDEQIFPSYRSYDGSYIDYTVKYEKNEFRVQSTVKDGEQIVLITPIQNGIKPAVIFVEAGIMWDRPGYVMKKDDKLVGVLENREIEVYVSGLRCEERNTGSNNPYISVSLAEKIGISTGNDLGAEKIQSLIDEAEKNFMKESEKFGNMKETYLAMKCCLAWDTIFEPDAGQICSTVSRIWNQGWGGSILFCWDTFFASMMISVENRDLAYSNVLAILSKMTDTNFIPGGSAATGFKTYNRSQPPVGSMAVLNIYSLYHEKEFVEYTFDTLSRWNEWFYQHRMVADGTLCWGSDPFDPVTGNQWESIGIQNTFGGALESGLDNSPMYDGMPFNKETNLMELSDVGLTGLYINDCRCLIDLAKIIGRDTKVFEERMAKAEAGLQGLWCDSFGLFLNKRTDNGEFSYRISPTNFYSLYSDNLTETQISRMVKEHFYNEEEFWGEYVLPSIARNDPAYPEQNYWRGRIWGPMNYLVYEALKRCHLKDACTDLADKSNDLFLKEWNLNKHVHENYSAETGLGCGVKNSDKFYHWGGLLGYVKFLNEKKEG